MSALETLGTGLPDVARDIRLNLQSTFGPSALSETQRDLIALAVAITTGNRRLVAALQTDIASEAVREDAQAAAVLMAMNNVYYRFRHVVGKESYTQKPARLRMQRLAKPTTSKADFELTCLAVSAVNGCEACVRAHEAVVLQAGLTEEHVHDAVRLAATLRATAVAAELSPAA